MERQLIGLKVDPVSMKDEWSVFWVMTNWISNNKKKQSSFFHDIWLNIGSENKKTISLLPQNRPIVVH